MLDDGAVDNVFVGGLRGLAVGGGGGFFDEGFEDGLLSGVLVCNRQVVVV